MCTWCKASLTEFWVVRHSMWQVVGSVSFWFEVDWVWKLRERSWVLDADRERSGKCRVRDRPGKPEVDWEIQTRKGRLRSWQIGTREVKRKRRTEKAEEIALHSGMDEVLRSELFHYWEWITGKEKECKVGIVVRCRPRCMARDSASGASLRGFREIWCRT